mmetsp:Transcript_9031/g.15687  ORF Transcript_9031/g.15687 Transcript_9031/m.15687 type:complete len:274 (+) Transcript_9031:3-824(+)|eukprot:CAMPEP_0119108480 /NCGR_PEP_ID=MMETSP1180-20130426/14612_1 /TAXON_ID=3052 ORGANISM="Chlamydomonas cf sp, Strain CCMP681" /NCGR_SAMPLE_ID=MMETSP1180 /ASSEMBLY_ACC=CAM_ASM_000741 /LENGTH=273 /DNA_ID=CAMNT_0007094097 /DNA_START=3 /DNA_END=824 /DNA_ORIENTATION=+
MVMLCSRGHALRVAVRQLAWAGSAQETWTAGFASASTQPRGIIEVREYLVKPASMQAYVKLTEQYATVRKELLPILGMFQTDLGGPLTKLTHFYNYVDLDERDRIRAAAAAHPGWREFIRLGREHLDAQSSRIMLESTPVYEALSLPATRHFKSPTAEQAKQSQTQPVYEMRTYQLHPGYGSVPKLVQAFASGLPSKVAADPEGQLVFFGHTDVGTLNNVLEVWRYPSAQQCIRARQAARGVPQWKDTIAAVTPGVQFFTSEFAKPVSWSPWQ